MSEFNEKVVVITGGAHGIGRCMVDDFMQQGAKVIVIDKIKSDLSCSFFYEGDIADKVVLETFFEQVIEQFLGIDFLINNACAGNGGLLSSGYEEFLYTQKIGVLAPFMLTKLFAPYFFPHGAIVNIASTRAFQSQENTECYTAAKGGIVALTHALAVSLRGKVRVNCVSPGWINTTNEPLLEEDHAQHLVAKVGEPSDISHAVQFLCSEKSRFMTGENIIIDGGMSKLMIYHNDNGWTYTP